MTIVGKILVFIVLILALVWNALVVNAYVTRVNWKKELDDTRKTLAETTVAAYKEREEAVQSRSVAAAKVRQMEEEVKKLLHSNQVLSSEKDALNDKIKAYASNEMATQTRDVKANTNVERTLKQVDNIQERLTVSEALNNTRLVATEAAKNDALKEKIDADANRRRADQLEEQLLKDRERKLRGDKGEGAAPPAVDKDFRASVVQVAGDTVVIKLGSNAKLQKGAVLQLARYGETAKYVGTIEITAVEPFVATGRFTPPATVTKPTAADLPKVGDIALVIN